MSYFKNNTTVVNYIEDLIGVLLNLLNKIGKEIKCEAC